MTKTRLEHPNDINNMWLRLGCCKRAGVRTHVGLELRDPADCSTMFDSGPYLEVHRWLISTMNLQVGSASGMAFVRGRQLCSRTFF